MKRKTRTGVLWAVLGAALIAAGPVIGSDETLQAARTELQALEAAARQERDDYDSALATGRLSSSQVAEYEGYLQTLERMIERQRVRVAILEGKPVPDAGVLDDGALDAPAVTDDERVMTLDAELTSSLGDFDDMLLREQEMVAQKASSSSAQSSSAAAGQQGGTNGAESAGEDTFESMSGDANTAGEAQAGEQMPTDESQTVETAGRTDEGGVPGVGVPADIPDGRDDDVVARQLREAAEKETDPELRERLWNEYRKYKKGSR